MRRQHHILRWTTLLVLLLAIAACTKTDLPVNNNKQEVTFSSKTVSKNSQKESSLKTSTLQIDYAIIGINNSVYKIPVYKIDGVVYTTSIKLKPGNYTLTKFLLMNSGTSANDSTDDVPVYALPMAGSDYAAFVQQPAGFSFSVGSLNKNEIPVEVLLFNPADYQKFGFDFTILPHTTIRHQLFAGRFLPVDPAVYTGSLYQSQTDGLRKDMPAIFRIDVFRNGHFVKSFNNEGNFGQQTMKVSYPDDNKNNDNFRLDLYLYAKYGNNFGYRFINSWYFSNSQRLHHSSDGVTHFVIGDTQNPQTDYAFGPYINLPQNCTLTVDQGYAPGNLGSYFDGDAHDILSGYKLPNGTYPYWCGTDTVSINLGHTYNMDVFNSLTPDALPAYTRYPERWNEINWLFNHLDNYAFYDWDILQGAIWMILNDWNGTGHSHVSDANSIVIKMVNDARAHTDFIPGFTQKAAVIFIPQHTHHDETIPKVQVVFTFIEIN